MGQGKFTDRGQFVIVEAKRESFNFKHGYIGTEHILLGIVNEGGYAAEVLKNNNISAENIREKIESDFLGFGEIDIDKEELILTPRTKNLFDESFNEAKKLNHNFVSPEQLLLSIINQKDGVAYTILEKLGADFKNIKNDLLEYLNSIDKIILDEEIEEDIETKMPMLSKYSRNLTKLAKEGILDPVIGRKAENQRVLEILCRRIKNNPCLIGEPGVGKTAVVEGLAQRIVEGNIPEILKGKEIFSLDLTSVIAGAKYRGEFEERLKKVMEEVKENKEVILFIDEIHSIIGAGGAEGAIDASNILKPSLARGEIQCIGATTIDEYRKYIEKDSALERRFQPVTVGEPSKEETLSILKGLRNKYETHHKANITDDALKAAVEMSDRYITDRYMPDKAIDLIDEAAAKVRIESLNTPSDFKNIEEKIDIIKKDKEEAINSQNFEKAAELRDEEKRIENKLEKMKCEWSKIISNKVLEVKRENIANVVASWTKIPVEKINEEESEKLLMLEERLHRRVIGQNEAVESIARAVRRARVGLKNPNRPIGSFIFLGPTGVGKTELSKALAENIFSDENNMIRIDMTEYMEKHSVAKLIGAPPGYVGYDEGGQLTEAVRRRPYSVVLLDEIEKAHPDVFNILLQILEDGRLTDGKGKIVNFKNTIIIMTSNVGASSLKKQKNVGFSLENRDEEEYVGMKESLLEALKLTFKPEFLNRVDDIIVFHKLEKADMIKIIDIMLKELEERLKENNIYVNFTNESKEFLLNKCNNKEFGARPLRRVITKEVEDLVSEEILRGNIEVGRKLNIEIENNKIIFR